MPYKLVSIICLVFPISILTTNGNDEIFKTNLGDRMQIGVSEKGYKSVQLKCGSDSMHVSLVTEEDFEGVIYTKGNFYDKRAPCYLDPGAERSRRSFAIKFPLRECNTKKEGEIYSNILVLQHDKDLIMPGDAAFRLECDFNKERTFTVNANLNDKQENVVSRISLTDADPSFKETGKREKRSIENNTNTVILTQQFLKQLKQRKSI